jgi:cyclic pyranopterin phosphate synthase
VAKLSHLDGTGRARMVDVSDKAATVREAIARARVTLAAETFALVRSGQLAKGDVLTVAKLAGIQAAKRTAELIPLCHPLALTFVDVALTLDDASSTVEIQAICRCKGETGVEMEAITAASVAALTIYDMCKAVERGITITDIRLLTKRGGKSGEYRGA